MISTVTVWVLARRLACNRMAGIIAASLFAGSLGLELQASQIGIELPSLKEINERLPVNCVNRLLKPWNSLKCA